MCTTSLGKAIVFACVHVLAASGGRNCLRLLLPHLSPVSVVLVLIQENTPRIGLP